MKKGAYILFILTNLLVLNSFAQGTIDSTNIDSLLLAKKEAYYPKTFTLEDSVFEVGSVLMKNILFNFNETEVHKRDISFLYEIAHFLIENENIVIIIKNHSDSRGRPQYSTLLSMRRAEEIKEYLFNKGINVQRLIAIGYNGESPIIKISEINLLSDKRQQEQAHALNRRTVFEIASLDYVKR